MAGSKVSDYAIGDANLDNIMLTLDKTYLGKMSLSLTEMATTTVPQIAAGSWSEVDGSLYKFDSNEAISTTDPVNGGTVADGVCYITLVPSGSSCTAAFVDTAPVWNPAKQGYYYATTSYRVVGRCTKSGSSYTLKYIYLNNESMAVFNDLRVTDDLFVEDNIEIDGNCTVDGDIIADEIAFTTGLVSTNGDITLTNGEVDCFDLTASGQVTFDGVAGLSVTNGDIDCYNVTQNAIASSKSLIRFTVTKPITAIVVANTNFELTNSSWVQQAQINGAGTWVGALNPGYYEINGTGTSSLTVYGCYGSASSIVDSGVIVTTAT